MAISRTTPPEAILARGGVFGQYRIAGCDKQGSTSFLKKKKQKTFALWRRAQHRRFRVSQTGKSLFASFSSEKEESLIPPCQTPNMARLSCPRAFLAPTAVSALALAGVLAASAAPRITGPVALMFPPWWNAARAVAAAATVGAVIRLGGVPFVAIVAPSTPAARAAYRQSGAWLLLDPALVTGCFTPAR